MKTIFRFVLTSIMLASTLISTAAEIKLGDVERLYIRCEEDEEGKLWPNYFIVCGGESYQTDSETFYTISKAMANNAEMRLSLDEHTMQATQSTILVNN